MKKIINITDLTVTFTFDNEEEVVVGMDKMFDVKANAMMHGLSQKIGDSAASFKTDAERRGAVLDMIEQLEGGTWNKKSGGGVSLLLEALQAAPELCPKSPR